MGLKEGTWREQAGRSREQELGCSEVLGIALRALFGGDGGGELRGLESRVRPNPNCRGKLVALPSRVFPLLSSNGCADNWRWTSPSGGVLVHRAMVTCLPRSLSQPYKCISPANQTPLFPSA